MRTGMEARLRTGAPAALACSAVLLAGVVLLRVYGIGVGESLLFFGYLCAWVYLPGWLVYRLLSDDPGGAIRQFAIGGGLGYVLSVFAFMFTAAIGFRELLDFYPLIVGIPAALLWWTGRVRSPGDNTVPEPESGSSLFLWTVAVVCIVVMTSVAIAFFGVSPLPGSGTYTYVQDFTWAMSVTADALHHWPTTEPSVSGQPVPYHAFTYYHLASASQVTGIDLTIVFFRLWILPVVVLAILQMVAAGRSLLGTAAGGLAAAALAFLVGDWGIASGGVFTALTLSSPTFLFGIIVLVPLTIVVAERLRSGSMTDAPGAWVLLALLAAGSGGSKLAILPLLIGAVAIFGLVSWLRQKRFPRVVAAVFSILSVIQLVFYVLLFRGHSSGLSVDLTSGTDFLNTLTSAGPVKDQILDWLPNLPLIGEVLSLFGLVIAAFALIGPPLVGLWWFFSRRNRPLTAVAWFLCAEIAIGLVFFFVVATVGTGNNLYFFFYAFVAAALMSGAGLRLAYSERQPLVEARWTVLILLVFWAIAVAAYVAVPGWVEPDGSVRNLMIGYGILLGGMAVFGLAARHFLIGVKGGAAAVIAAAFIMVGLVDAPRAFIAPVIGGLPEKTSGYRLTPGLFRALTWLRTETPEDTVVMVNNQQGELVTGYKTAYDYAAFSERHFFLAGWGYSIASRDAGYGRVLAGFNPFADRQELNDRAFGGDAEAIEILESDFGVRYALVDGINGDPAALEKIKPFGRVVYQAPGVAIVELD